MMRFFGIVLAALIATSAAFAADWLTSTNDRFGYSVEIPPGFRMGREPDNSDGGTFTGLHGDRVLVFGVMLLDAFESEASNRVVYAMDDGWDITYSRGGAGWTAYSGTKGNRILYVRGMQLCDGTAAFAMLEYRRQDLKTYDPIVKRMVKSLKSTQCPQ